MSDKRQKRERLYNIYSNMRQRCLNPNSTFYYRYGGRGITICPEWLNSFSAFKEWALQNGYRGDLSIDRIDNDKGYSPDNCRWADQSTQSNNTAKCHFIIAFGQKHSMMEWAKITGISYNTLKKRAIAGESGEYMLRRSRREGWYV